MNDARLRALAEQTMNLAIGPRQPPLHGDPVVFDIVELCNMQIASDETKSWFDQNKGKDDAFLVALYALRPDGPLAGGATERGCQFPFQIGRGQFTNGWVLAAQRMTERVVSQQFWPKPPSQKQLDSAGIHQFMTRARQVMKMLQPGTDAFTRIQVVVDMLEFIAAPSNNSMHKFVRAAAIFQLLGIDSSTPVAAVNIMLGHLYLEAREYSDNRYLIAAALDPVHQEKSTNALMQMTWQNSSEPPDKLINAIKQSLYRTIEEARIDIAEKRAARKLPNFSLSNPIRFLYDPKGTFAFQAATVTDATDCLRQACVARQIPLNLLRV